MTGQSIHSKLLLSYSLIRAGEQRTVTGVVASVASFVSIRATGLLTQDTQVLLRLGQRPLI